MVAKRVIIQFVINDRYVRSRANFVEGSSLIFYTGGIADVPFLRRSFCCEPRTV